MRLVDLNPHWVSYGGEGITDVYGNSVPERQRIGISFNCPCGNCKSKIIILFENPEDNGGPVTQNPHWTRTGNTFESLTLRPSIQRLSECRWHVYVTNGEVHAC